MFKFNCNCGLISFSFVLGINTFINSITFGDKNYGNITIKIQNTTYLYEE